MRTVYLLKVLNHHARPARSSAAKETSGTRHCGVHVFSGDRRCTCGRDKAIDELTTLLENQQPTPREELTVPQLLRRLGRKICAEGYQDKTGFHYGVQTHE